MPLINLIKAATNGIMGTVTPYRNTGDGEKSLVFADRQDLIGLHIGEHLVCPAWPGQFYFVCLRGISQAKVYSLVARRVVAHGGGGMIILDPLSCSQLYASAQPVSIAFCAS